MSHHKPPASPAYVAEGGFDVVDMSGAPACAIPKPAHKTGHHFHFMIFEAMKASKYPQHLHSASDSPLRKPYPRGYPLCEDATQVAFLFDSAGVWNATFIQHLMAQPQQSSLQITFVRSITSIAASSLTYHGEGNEVSMGQMKTKICDHLAKTIVDLSQPMARVPRAWRTFVQPQYAEVTTWSALRPLVEEFVNSFNVSRRHELEYLREFWTFRSSPREALQRVGLLSGAVAMAASEGSRYLRDTVWCKTPVKTTFGMLYTSTLRQMKKGLTRRTRPSPQLESILMLEMIRMIALYPGMPVNIGLVAASALSAEEGPWVELAGNGMLRNFAMKEDELLFYTWLLGVYRERWGAASTALEKNIHLALHRPHQTATHSTSIRAVIDRYWSNVLKGVEDVGPSTPADGGRPPIVDFVYRTALIWDSLVFLVDAEGLLSTPRFHAGEEEGGE